jgi:hypothetical protein
VGGGDDGGEEMTEEDFRYLYRHLDATHKRKLTRLGAKGDHYFQLTFWIVWKWATKQEWWEEFITYALNHEADPRDGIKVSDFCTQLVDPTRFPKLIVDFLRERQKGEGDGLEIR